MAQRSDGLRALAPRYKAIFSDVWGVLHNGKRVYTHAADALARFREEGGRVVLITNSPRPMTGVRDQLTEMGVRTDAWDEIATSGDVTRDLIAALDRPFFHLGPERDLPLFDGLDTQIVGLEEAQAIVCTGMFDDESETPEDYRDMLEKAHARDLPFVCANPDIVVERGDRLIWCAGALARDYEALGGETRIAGKPHAPIYALARRKLEAVGGEGVGDDAILAIGDGMPTDVKGARDAGLDLLYIAAGIHGGEYGGGDTPDEAALAAFLEKNDASPVAWMPRLVW